MCKKSNKSNGTTGIFDECIYTLQIKLSTAKGDYFSMFK